jgi:hypothetical protein
VIHEIVDVFFFFTATRGGVHKYYNIVYSLFNYSCFRAVEHGYVTSYFCKRSVPRVVPTLFSRRAQKIWYLYIIHFKFSFASTWTNFKHVPLSRNNEKACLRFYIRDSLSLSLSLSNR